jgi:opacity protein-like surface antigen
MWKKVYWSAGLIMLMITQVNAQSISFGPQLGYEKVRDADQGNLMGGAALRFKLGPAIGVEGAINYRQQNYENDALTVRSWPIMVTGLIYPIPVVYGIIGFGWYNSTFDYDQSKSPFQAVEDETKREVGWHFGGGVELPVGSTSKFTADIRWVYLDYTFDEIPGSAGVDSNSYIITAGFLFGL